MVQLKIKPTLTQLLLCFACMSLGACSTCGEEITIVAPCDVVLSFEDSLKHENNPQGVDAALKSQYWRPGPYYTWNTSPGAQCNKNPTTISESVSPDTALMITYPSKQNPLVTGYGDIADGPWPVIIFSHANNDTVCSIFERYNTLHQHWASWGYVVVSVDDTRYNCNPGTTQNIRDRSNTQLAALTSLMAWHEDEQSLFHQKLDTSNVIFAGHSRGGGASIVSWKDAPTNIKGIIDLQGVDTTSFGFGTFDIDVPVLGITASKDVDLNYPYVEPTEDQITAPYSWVTIFGGIHAYTADSVPIESDDEPGISQRQQHDITNYYTTAFLKHFIGLGDGSSSPSISPEDASTILFSHDGAGIIKREVSEQSVAVRWNRFKSNSVNIDHFEGPRSDGDASLNLLGGQNSSMDLSIDKEVPTYEPDVTNPSRQYAKAYSRMLVAKNQPGTFTMTLGQAPMMFESGTTFQARIKGPDNGTLPDFDVVFMTGDGEIIVPGDQVIGPISITNRFVQLVIDLNAHQLENIDISSVGIVLRDGTLFMDDPRFVLP